MKIVYAPGCWDLLHVGHLAFLERAASLGDNLIVGVPSDDVVLQDKGDLPIIPLMDRLRMVQSLRCVTCAVPYYRLEFLHHLNMLRPDILAVGETWGHDQRHIDAEAWVSSAGSRLVKLPYSMDDSTTAIKQRIRNGCTAAE